jgi:oligopeptide/dipeptide ABC transporter ATP-binding protein
LVPLLLVQGIQKYYAIAKGVFSCKTDYVRAVDGVDLELKPGEILSLVGESGCGKSTLARLIAAIIPKDKGRIIYRGKDLDSLSKEEIRQLRRHIQMIFQDPYTSLNPRMKVAEIVREPLVIHKIGTKIQQRERVAHLLERVGLQPDHMERYPHEFSGGQRQRIAIARALATMPELVIGDEPVSALDVSIQAQIINLFQDLQNEFNLTYIFISHDLRLVMQISHRIAVMYLGKIVEFAPAEAFYSSPHHPYTEILLSSIPWPDPNQQKKKVILSGEPPNQIKLPAGCRFYPRCPNAFEPCYQQEPLLKRLNHDHYIACYLK